MLLKSEHCVLGGLEMSHAILGQLKLFMGNWNLICNYPWAIVIMFISSMGPCWSWDHSWILKNNLNIFNIKINVACLNYSTCCNMSQNKCYSPSERSITKPLSANCLLFYKKLLSWLSSELSKCSLPTVFGIVISL